MSNKNKKIEGRFNFESIHPPLGPISGLVVVVGDLTHGFRFYGPMKDVEECGDFEQNILGGGRDDVEIYRLEDPKYVNGSNKEDE